MTGHRDAMVLFTATASAMFSGKLYTVNKEGGLSEVVPLPAAFVAIRPTENNWLTTG